MHEYFLWCFACDMFSKNVPKLLKERQQNVSIRLWRYEDSFIASKDQLICLLDHVFMYIFRYLCLLSVISYIQYMLFVNRKELTKDCRISCKCMAKLSSVYASKLNFR